MLKVAIPQRGAWDAGVAELGQRGGIFKKHGLKLEILYTSAGPESIQALIGGSIDIATASGVSAAFGTFAKGAPIRIIGSEMIGAPDLYWYVPAASPIKKIEDFNGKTVAYLAHRLVEPCGPARADRAVSSDREADLDRQHLGDHHADHDRAGRCRLRRRAVRARPGRRRQDPHRRDRQRRRLAAHPHRARQPHQRGDAWNRRDVLVRFVQGYKETVDWMYSDPAALKIYGEYSGLPENIVKKVRELIPKDAWRSTDRRAWTRSWPMRWPDKFIPAPLRPTRSRSWCRYSK